MLKIPKKYLSFTLSSQILILSSTVMDIPTSRRSLYGVFQFQVMADPNFRLDSTRPGFLTTFAPRLQIGTHCGLIWSR